MRSRHFLALALAGAGLLAVAGGTAQAQDNSRPQAPAQAVQPPLPSQLELVKLIWTTMVAVDNANTSGNYSVLRDNSASGFQMANDQARLTQIFSGLRSLRLDLANTLLVPPTFTAEPRYIQPNVIELQGVFPIRPNPIRFDPIYQWEQERWKLFGIQVGPLEAAPPAQPAPPQDAARRGNR